MNLLENFNARKTHLLIHLSRSARYSHVADRVAVMYLGKLLS